MKVACTLRESWRLSSSTLSHAFDECNHHVISTVHWLSHFHNRLRLECCECQDPVSAASSEVLGWLLCRGFHLHTGTLQRKLTRARGSLWRSCSVRRASVRIPSTRLPCHGAARKLVRRAARCTSRPRARTPSRGTPTVPLPCCLLLYARACEIVSRAARWAQNFAPKTFRKVISPRHVYTRACICVLVCERVRVRLRVHVRLRMPVHTSHAYVHAGVLMISFAPSEPSWMALLEESPNQPSQQPRLDKSALGQTRSITSASPSRQTCR